MRSCVLAAACLLLPSLVLSVSAADARKAEVDAYLGEIAESHQTLYKVGERFGKTLGPLLQGNQPDSREVHRAFRDVAQTLGRVRRDVKTWTVPDHPTARKLAVANDEFMEYQVKATLEWLPKIIDIMEDDTPHSGSPRQESARGTRIRWCRRKCRRCQSSRSLCATGQ